MKICKVTVIPMMNAKTNFVDQKIVILTGQYSIILVLVIILVVDGGHGGMIFVTMKTTTVCVVLMEETVVVVIKTIGIVQLVNV